MSRLIKCIKKYYIDQVNQKYLMKQLIFKEVYLSNLSLYKQSYIRIKIRKFKSNIKDMIQNQKKNLIMKNEVLD